MSTMYQAREPLPIWSARIGEAMPPLSLSPGGYLKVERSDTQRRRKPSGIDKLLQATPASTVITETCDRTIAFSGGGWHGVTTVNAVYGSGLGIGSENARFDHDFVRNKLRSSARDSGVNLAQMLAEYEQTASLFVDCARTVYRLTRDLKARNFRRMGLDFRFWNRKLSNAVLQYQYGISPLISDINDSIEALKNASVKPLYIRSKASKKNRDRIVYPQPASFYWPATDTVIDVEYSVSGWSVFMMNNEALHSTLGSYGFTNPLALGYELIPYSFVLDWWINVGEFLASLDNSLYIKSGYCQLSYRELYHKYNSVWSDCFTKQQSSVRLGVEGLSSVASLVYKPSASKMHILNGVALLGSLLPR